MEMISEVTALSSKGQVVLPKTIRDAMSLEVGMRFMVFSDGDNILLKPIKQPDIFEFASLMDAAKKWAENVEMKEDDISEAIKKVRKNRRNDK